MCKSFSLKKILYESSTVAQIAERFEPNTVLWAFHTLQPSSFIFLFTIYWWFYYLLSDFLSQRIACNVLACSEWRLGLLHSLGGASRRDSTRRSRQDGATLLRQQLHVAASTAGCVTWPVSTGHAGQRRTHAATRGRHSRQRGRRDVTIWTSWRHWWVMEPTSTPGTTSVTRPCTGLSVCITRGPPTLPSRATSSKDPKTGRTGGAEHCSSMGVS